jgi:hypothetical protein
MVTCLVDSRYRHDEAATHYVDMIDQTTLGHNFILEEFGVQPRIGWQIGMLPHPVACHAD